MPTKSILLGFIACGAIAVAVVAGVGYFEEKNEGPAEEIGEAVDEAASDASRAVEDAAD